MKQRSLFKAIPIIILSLLLSLSFTEGRGIEDILRTGLIPHPNRPSISCLLPEPDYAFWMTMQVRLNDGLTVDTTDFSFAFFDSSGVGLDADTCWLDNEEMVKGEGPRGYFYYLTEEEDFKYRFNYLYLFRAKGRGSIPGFTDTLRSPVNDIEVINPQPNETIWRGEDLMVEWVIRNEHNVGIQIADAAGETLTYFPLYDTGRFIIPATDLEILLPGPINFSIGRLNIKFSFDPGFPLIAMSMVSEEMPLELSERPGIEEGEIEKTERMFNPFGTTHIVYRLSRPERVSLLIYDKKGRKVREIREEGKAEGLIFWDKKDERGNRVSEGVYLFNLRTEGRDHWGKFIIMR